MEAQSGGGGGPRSQSRPTAEPGRDRGPCSLVMRDLPEAHFSKGLSGSSLPRLGKDAGALGRVWAPMPLCITDPQR